MKIQYFSYMIFENNRVGSAGAQEQNGLVASALFPIGESAILLTDKGKPAGSCIGDTGIGRAKYSRALGKTLEK